MLKKALVLLCVMLLCSVAFAQNTITGTTLVELNLRNQPSSSGTVISKLAVKTSLVIEGRDKNETWLLVHTVDGGLRGWVAIQYVQFDQAISIRTLPDMTDVDLSQPLAANGQPQATPPVIPPESHDYPALWLDDQSINHAHEIYNRGQQMGDNPNMLIKIGESNMAGTVFLCPFNYGKYDLGPYKDDLQGVVDRFNSTHSLCHYDFTARSGFAAANLLDPQWAVEPDCQKGETPLQCGYRIYHPSYALIYLGVGDMGFYSPEQYHDNLVKIIQFLSDHGVVPVLSTFPMADTFNDGKPQIFNAVIRQIVTDEHLPLIDVRSAEYTYPNRGMGPDGYHFSVRDTSTTDFTGDEKTYGRTERELLTLQMLKALSF